MGQTLAEHLAEFVVTVATERLKEDAITWTKLTFLDWLGNAIAGSQSDPAQRMHKALAGEVCRGTEANATLIGFSRKGHALVWTGNDRTRTSPLWATLMNGTSSHILELDDVHKASILHAGTVVIPVALAVAESLHASGQQLIEAIVAGFDVCIRIGEGVTPAHYKYFHTTGTAGTFGAAAAAAKLFRLNSIETTHAFGNAGTQAAGLWEFIETGAMSKHLHSGKAGFNGLLSALLAQEGFTGAPSILEGNRGFMRAMADEFDETKVLIALGERYKVVENCFKIHSSCRHTHHAMDVVLKLVQENEIAYEDIDVLDVGTYQVALDITDNPNPRTLYAAKFSLQFCSALAAVKGKAGLAEFTEQGIWDERVRALLPKVQVRIDPNCQAGYPDKWGATVRIITRNGCCFVGHTDYPHGDFENPVTRVELVEKFRTLTLPMLDKLVQETLIGRVLSLEEMNDVSTFFD